MLPTDRLEHLINNAVSYLTGDKMGVLLAFIRTKTEEGNS